MLPQKFTVPKLPQPPHPPYPKASPNAIPAPGATRTHPTISLTLKSSRNPSLALTLSSIDPSTTTIAQLRESIQNELGGATVVTADKIKILYHRKPVPASKKTVGDLLQGESLDKGKPVELGVMVLGGAPDPPPRTDASSGSAALVPPDVGAEQEAEASAPPVPAPAPEKMEGTETLPSPPPVQGASGKQVLQTEAFWKDLQGFLEQRIRDEAEAVRLVQKWRSAWNAD
jgi:ubiquitin-like protein 4